MIFVFEHLIIRYRIRYAYIRQVIIEVTVTVFIYFSTCSSTFWLDRLGWFESEFLLSFQWELSLG